ncbi:FtsB family cell division protein [Peptoniphilus sp.]|jgi:cell division protein FtsB|uniref:FtsB family cell division protein n=1 Tax=Peptoniphilus sp. TaxID=1971214 RepID=UPI003D921DF9
MKKSTDRITKKRYNVRRNKIQNKPFMFTMIIVAVVLISVIAMYSQVASLDRQILAQQTKIDELTKVKNSLAGEVKGIRSSAQVADEAMYRLGMVYPKENQIVYVDSSEEKKVGDINYNVFLSPIVSVLRSFTKD